MRDDRDTRLDFFRGLALLLMFVDHVEMASGVHLAGAFTLHGLLPCDAAEVFVFISGLVCGASYGRVLRQQGYLACQQKAMRRALLLYIANLITLFVAVDLVLLVGLPLGGFYERLALTGLERHPAETVLASLALLYQPLGFDILTMYIQLLLMLPSLLYLESRWRGSGLVVSISLYVMAQFVPEVNLPKYPEVLSGIWGTGRLFNHFAWGLLFFLAAGWGARSITTCSRHPWWEGGLCCAGIVVLLGLALVKAVFPMLPEESIFAPISKGYLWMASSPLCEKGTLGTARLACFLILACVTSWLVPRDSNWLRWCAAKWIAVCGRNALPLFCASLVLTFMVWPIVAMLGERPPIIVAYEAAGCLLLISLGLIRERSKCAAGRPSPQDRRLFSKGKRRQHQYNPSGLSPGVPDKPQGSIAG